MAMGAVNSHATVHATVNQHTMDLDMSVGVKATMDTFVSAWLSDKENPPSVAELVRTVGGKMDFKAAAAKMEKKKLPDDVAVLIKTAATDESESQSRQPFSE